MSGRFLTTLVAALVFVPSAAAAGSGGAASVLPEALYDSTWGLVATGIAFFILISLLLPTSSHGLAARS